MKRPIGIVVTGYGTSIIAIIKYMHAHCRWLKEKLGYTRASAALLGETRCINREAVRGRRSSASNDRAGRHHVPSIRTWTRSQH
jgi:hypothetical protein